MLKPINKATLSEQFLKIAQVLPMLIQEDPLFLTSANNSVYVSSDGIGVHHQQIIWAFFFDGPFRNVDRIYKEKEFLQFIFQINLNFDIFEVV